MATVFTTKRLTARHAQILAAAIAAANGKKRSHTLPEDTAQRMIDAARAGSRARKIAGNAVAAAGRHLSIPKATGLRVEARPAKLPNSYKYAATGTVADLTLVIDEQGNETWAANVETGYVQKAPYGTDCPSVTAVLAIPVGRSDDAEAARAARASLVAKGWRSSADTIRLDV